MLKPIREGGRNHPWLLKSLVGALALAFVITMGWWGFGQPQTDAVASVGKLNVSRAEYRTAYQNLYRLYKEQLPGDFEDETLKQLTIDGLIERKLWLLAAEDLGLTVTPGELRETILQREGFQQNGRFDAVLYRRVLAANRLTPALFESQVTLDLLIEKARTVVSESVALSPAEVEEAQALKARQSKADPSAGTSAYSRILRDILFQKQQRALTAYRVAMQAKTPIEIRRELL